MELCPGVFASILWWFTLNYWTSFASEIRNRILHSPPVVVEQTPNPRCFQYLNFATFSVVVLVEVRQESFFIID